MVIVIAPTVAQFRFVEKKVNRPAPMIQRNPILDFSHT